MINVTATLHTDGSGYWSRKSRAVRITELRVPYIDDEGDFGELRVYFNQEDWDCENDGDIYTDDLFIKELHEWLNANDLTSKGVSYSEHGMQGNKFVSLDVGREFLEAWTTKHDAV